MGIDGHSGLGNGDAELGLGHLLHLEEYHRGDIVQTRLLGLAAVPDFNVGLDSLDLEGPMLHVALDLLFGNLAADDTLGRPALVLVALTQGECFMSLSTISSVTLPPMTPLAVARYRSWWPWPRQGQCFKSLSTSWSVDSNDTLGRSQAIGLGGLVKGNASASSHSPPPCR